MIADPTTSRSMRVGLTGGIASGKSTVADFFAEHGVVIIDTDIIARSVVEPGQPALDEIRDEFGSSVVAADGSLNRKAMRQIVFSDEVLRQRLESITHPRIRMEAVRQAESAAGPYHIIVVPLLAQSPMRAEMDRILVVDCREDVQLARLLERDAESEAQAIRMIESQIGREERLVMADDVIRNDGAIDDTRAQVKALHTRYLSLAGDTSA